MLSASFSNQLQHQLSCQAIIDQLKEVTLKSCDFSSSEYVDIFGKLEENIEISHLFVLWRLLTKNLIFFFNSKNKQYVYQLISKV